jgi:tetratricopeptide (TPR) repeat protein
LDEAETALKEALQINPVSTKIILELCDIYKMRTPTFNKFYFYTMDALKYAYSGYELARIYRNLGFYYYEENNIKLTIACYMHSLKFENDPFVVQRIEQLENNYKIILTDEECQELMQDKHIKLGAHPFIIENLEKLAMEENFKYAYITTGTENATAIALYEKLGYEKIDNFGIFENDDICLCMKKEFKTLIF